MQKAFQSRCMLVPIAPSWWYSHRIAARRAEFAAAAWYGGQTLARCATVGARHNDAAATRRYEPGRCIAP